ncbi:hypothetical protein ACFQJD_12550 [Haloplanus sp. GCM10025708]|uniref:hypothetical protein n=1 Tax=Haloferacaceae TaxID=1644056 RepID=UPI0036099F8F
MTEDSADRLEEELRGHNVDVQSLDPGDPLELTYLTAFPATEVNHTEMGQALTALVELAEAGEWEPSRVEATVLRTDDDVQATWHAEAEWFRELVTYGISETEFSTRVLETVE